MVIDRAFCTSDDAASLLPRSLATRWNIVYRRAVRLAAEIADSLVLASFNIIVAAIGFLLLTTSYAILFVAVSWCALPVGLLLNLGFWVRDIRNKELRKQAKIAAFALLPLLVYEIWLVGFHRLDL